MSAWIKAPHRITTRRPRFDFSRTPAHWIADDPLVSQMLNIMQPITPAPERWFCQAIREALPLIRDERLREAATAFIKYALISKASRVLVRRSVHPLPRRLLP